MIQQAKRKRSIRNAARLRRVSQGNSQADVRLKEGTPLPSLYLAVSAMAEVRDWQESNRGRGFCGQTTLDDDRVACKMKGKNLGLPVP